MKYLLSLFIQFVVRTASPNKHGLAVRATMLFYFFIFSVSLFAADLNEQAILQAHDYRVRIRVIESARSIKLLPKQSIKIVDKNGKVQYTIQNLSAMKLDGTPGKIRITLNNGKVLKQLSGMVKIVPQAKDSRTFIAKLNSSNNNWKVQQKSDRAMRGNFLIYVNSKGSLQVVNQLHIEEYIYGVVRREMYPTARGAALKAQAVAARTTALHRVVHRPKNSRYDMEDNIHQDMAYSGSKDEIAEVNEAIDATRGLVMLYDGQLIDSVFHSNCGGATVNSKERWSKKKVPYLTPRWDQRFAFSRPSINSERQAKRWVNASPNSFCNINKAGFPDNLVKVMGETFRWQRTYTFEQMSRNFNVGTVSKLEVLDRDKSGRVRQLQVTGTKGSKVIENPETLAKIFNRSLFFYITKTKTGFTLKGAGFGHGIGLCQIGAMSMAAKGFSHKAILRHYYNNIKFEEWY